jgi:hypothetical protein
LPEKNNEQDPKIFPIFREFVTPPLGLPTTITAEDEEIELESVKGSNSVAYPVVIVVELQ